VKLERRFDRRLQNARAADTVDVADAAAEGPGDLTHFDPVLVVKF